MRGIRGVALLAAGIVAVGGAASARSATAAEAQTAGPMLTGAAPGVTVRPLITVGERRGSYIFESIPDGISLLRAGANRVHAFVNHETSLVPFPGTLSDFTNAMVSRLVLDGRTARVLSGTYVIPSEANFQRFCSNFLATREHGFSRPMLFTNEEATDRVNRTGTAWPAGPGAEQAGVVVAYDVQNNRYRAIYGMGRHNHENAVAVPGYRKPVLLSGDDTFSAPASQMYMYVAPNADAVWNDQGTLYAFKSDQPTVNDYGDIAIGRSTFGTFIPVPRDVAVGDQDALERWSNANGVLQFIRIEDIAYDRNTPNIVYFADTGEPRALPDTATGRLRRGPATAVGPHPNGRVFRMVLDPRDPLRVLNLSVLIEGDPEGPASAGKVQYVHNPDNLETTRTGLLIQEDPGSHNQYAPNDPNGTTARIWNYSLQTGALSVVARVNQSADPAARLGAWESSGIVDAQQFFGRGMFLVDVQAPTLILERAPGPGVTYEREGGQLLLIRIPQAADPATRPTATTAAQGRKKAKKKAASVQAGVRPSFPG